MNTKQGDQIYLLLNREGDNSAGLPKGLNASLHSVVSHIVHESYDHSHLLLLLYSYGYSALRGFTVQAFDGNYEVF